MSRIEARAAVELAARASYGRLVAILAAPTGDLALAEDTLADAFERALGTWPGCGVPDNPEGWLLTVARNGLRDVWKSSAHRSAVSLEAATDLGLDATSPLEDLDPDGIPDRRLELLLVCAHPAIDAAIRTPLMLQAVLGFEAAQIAAAYAVPPSAMAQRLVRAKKRIKKARIPFAIPDRHALAKRLPAVLEAVYGCYAIAWPRAGDVDSLAGEAHYLAVTLAALLGTEPEAWGLAALVTLSLARARPSDLPYLPLDEQDPQSWDAGLIAEGEAYLRRTGGAGPPGRFQLEAAIQAVHCDRASTGVTDWDALHTLYTALVRVAPNLGVRVAYAAIVGRLDGPDRGLALLDQIVDRAAADFQPLHAARADLLARAGRHAAAQTAYDRAIALCDDTRARAYFQSRRLAR
ncbi:MAG: RNA polymerase sigma factor [Mycobacteriales bacterium]